MRLSELEYLGLQFKLGLVFIDFDKPVLLFLRSC